MLYRHLVDELSWYAQNGDDDVLRASAISKLSIEFLKTDDAAIGAIIADFLRNESVSNDLRLIAYLCLLEVSRRAYDEYPNMETFAFPEDVDWGFVGRYSSQD
jgi:hypothetical protein